jgi:hypothetical protein
MNQSIYAVAYCLLLAVLLAGFVGEHRLYRSTRDEFLKDRARKRRFKVGFLIVLTVLAMTYILLGGPL